MVLSLSQVKPGISKGIRAIKDRLGFSIAPGGIKLDLIPSDRFSVSMIAGTLTIRYTAPVQIYRGLGIAAQKSRESDLFCFEESINFSTCGPMLDMSQNGVLTVKSVKNMIGMIALMGLNRLYLYLEDMYEVESLPYFGYMRGRYSKEELREIDDYADLFGIEVIPVIQTLGHLERALRWNYTRNIRDTKEILLAESKETYEFIEKLIVGISSCFRSKTIHLGMDESTNLGTGQFLSKKGYKNRSDILFSHLHEVLDIAKSLGLSPMVWSDMFFRLASESHDYYDPEAEITEDLIDRIPEGLSLVFWDYYHHNEEIYDAMISKHKKLCSRVFFAGGIWTWNSSATNYRKTFDTLNAGLNSCRKNEVKDFLITVWSDDGAEANQFSSLLGLQFAAEHMYGDSDSDQLRDRFHICTGGNFDDFWLMSHFDDTPGTDYVRGDQPVYNPSKFCLWQDLLIGLFDENVSRVPLQEHYEELYKQYKQRSAIDEWSCIHNYYERLADTLRLKTNLGISIRKAYKEGDFNELSAIADLKIESLIEKARALHEAHRHLWFSFCKSFGWEVLDIRYGGLIQRMGSVQKRLRDYLEGSIADIEELEADRLLYDGGFHFNDQWLLTENKYANCVTANQFSHNPGG